MHEVSVTIAPNDKYAEVIHGEYPSEEVPETEEEHIEQSNHHEAADAYLDTIAGTPTPEDLDDSPDVIEDGDDVVGKCPYCGRSWRTTPRYGRLEQAKDDVRSRVEAHLPCDEQPTETEPLSWDDFSVSNDPDLVKKIATYFDGMDPAEPTGLLRAKLRLLNCEVYADAQIAAQAELRKQ